MLPVCPKCDVGLIALSFKGIEVDYCDRCQGLWLDAGELEELMAKREALSGDSLRDILRQDGSFPHGRKYLCPRCDESMHQIVLNLGGEQESQLVIERCLHGHGLWCDAGELQRLLSAPLREDKAGDVIEFLNELLGVSKKS